jgi:ferredoxin
MCRWCVEYGKGTKWYLNEDNYKKDLYEAPDLVEWFHKFVVAVKKPFDVADASVMDDMALKNIFGGDPVSVAAEGMLGRHGQVIPLEDAYKVLNLTGDRFLLMHCACGRSHRQEDLDYCLFFEPAVDMVRDERPWEPDSRIIDKTEAKQFLARMSKLGCVHTLFDLGVDVDGPPPIPILIYNCTYRDYSGFVMRSHYGMADAPRKAEYVAVVNRKMCQEGCHEECKKSPKCLDRCQFGAMHFSPTQQTISIAISECAGCGLCRPVCPTGAISLKNRLDYPGLVDDW